MSIFIAFAIGLLVGLFFGCCVAHDIHQEECIKCVNRQRGIH